MNNFKLSLASLMLVFITLFSAPVALAGGQLVHLTADTEGWANGESYGRTMRFSLNVEYPCKDTQVTFKFVEPKDGDLITTAGDGATFIGKENGPTGNHCLTYAKFQSKAYGERLVTVDVKHNGSVWESPPVIKVHFDGKYHTDNHYDNQAYSSYPHDRFNSPSTPPSNPFQDGKIEVRLLQQELVSNSSRVVTIKWSAFDGSPTTSKVYGTSDKNSWNFLVDHQKGPSANLKIPNEDYFIKLNGCVDKYGTCVDSNVLFIPKLNTDSGKIVPLPIPSSSPSDIKSDDLAQKVASLEAQLAQSKKDQSVLEQRVNALVNFIKNIFPFFK